MNSSESLTYTMENEKDIRDKIINYARAKSLELYKKGPSRIEVNFVNDGLVIILYEPYSKTEISLLELNDSILTDSLMTIRCRIANLFSKIFEKDIGEIVNMGVRAMNPKFDFTQMSILYGFEYINNKKI